MEGKNEWDILICWRGESEPSKTGLPVACCRCFVRHSSHQQFQNVFEQHGRYVGFNLKTTRLAFTIVIYAYCHAYGTMNGNSAIASIEMSNFRMVLAGTFEQHFGGEVVERGKEEGTPNTRTRVVRLQVFLSHCPYDGEHTIERLHSRFSWDNEKCNYENHHWNNKTITAPGDRVKRKKRCKILQFTVSNGPLTQFSAVALSFFREYAKWMVGWVGRSALCDVVHLLTYPTKPSATHTHRPACRIAWWSIYAPTMEMECEHFCDDIFKNEWQICGFHSN